MNYAAEERSRQNVNKSHGRFQPRPDLADGGGGTGGGGTGGGGGGGGGGVSGGVLCGFEWPLVCACVTPAAQQAVLSHSLTPTTPHSLTPTWPHFITASLHHYITSPLQLLTTSPLLCSITTRTRPARLPQSLNYILLCVAKVIYIYIIYL